jgi:hypothetical protein
MKSSEQKGREKENTPGCYRNQTRGWGDSKENVDLGQSYLRILKTVIKAKLGAKIVSSGDSIVNLSEFDKGALYRTNDDRGLIQSKASSGKSHES